MKHNYTQANEINERFAAIPQYEHCENDLQCVMVVSVFWDQTILISLYEKRQENIIKIKIRFPLAKKEEEAKSHFIFFIQ